MIDETELDRQEKRLKRAYKLYDKRYPDFSRELSYAMRHTESGYLKEDVALYYIWLCDKAMKHILNTYNAINRISDSIMDPPSCEAESWMNDAKRECIKIIRECLGGKA